MIDIPEIEKGINAAKNKIREHQHQTVECIAFLPTGKILITDKPRLEELNTEIERLTGAVAKNVDCLARLRELIGGRTIAEIQHDRQRTAEFISRTKSLLSHDLGELLKRSPGLDLSSIQSHPKAVRLQAEAKDIIDVEGTKLEKLDSLMAEIETVLKELV